MITAVLYIHHLHLKTKKAKENTHST